LDWTQSFESLGGLGIERLQEVGFLPLVALMGISLLSSLFIAFLYVQFYESRSTGSHVHRSFPLAGLSITAIFITIQFSLPLSLGLLGALSIVRFRTPIKEPEEIGFILLIVATSLCCATFNMLFLGIVLLAAVVALLVLKYGRKVLTGSLNDGVFIVTLPTGEYRDKGERILSFLRQKLPRGKIDSIAENEDESIISYGFAHLDERALMELQPGLEDISAGARSNVYFNRSGEV
jgi:hypothetical protein